MTVAKRIDLRAFRRDPFALRFRVRGYNLATATMRFAVRLYPDAPGPPLVALAMTGTRGAQGIRVVASGVAGGIDWTDVEIIIAKTTVAAFPAAPEIGSDVALAYDFEWSRPDGESGFARVEETILFGKFIVQGSVSNG